MNAAKVLKVMHEGVAFEKQSLEIESTGRNERKIPPFLSGDKDQPGVRRICRLKSTKGSPALHGKMPSDSGRADTDRAGLRWAGRVQRPQGGARDKASPPPVAGGVSDQRPPVRKPESHTHVPLLFSVLLGFLRKALIWVFF